MMTFLGNFISSVILIFATLINSIIPMITSNSITEDLHFEKWSASDTYTIDTENILQKNPDEDFRILIFGDIQEDSIDMFNGERFETEALIKNLVDKTDPDMMVAIGDNARGIFAYEWFISFIDSFDIPWAAIMGNHDGQDIPGESWAAYKLEKADNSLFKFGPEKMGYGNYTAHISQNGQIIHSLYFMDTHDYISFYNGKEMIEGEYDGLWKNQVKWYEWNVNGLNSFTNSNVESSLFIHIPLPEYRDAAAVMESDSTAFGEHREWICASAINVGMFDTIKELGSTKNVICGHDHHNNFSTNYQGIRLSYVTKTGKGASHSDDLQGGSLLTIDENGTATYSNILV